MVMIKPWIVRAFWHKAILEKTRYYNDTFYEQSKDIIRWCQNTFGQDLKTWDYEYQTSMYDCDLASSTDSIKFRFKHKQDYAMFTLTWT